VEVGAEETGEVADGVNDGEGSGGGGAGEELGGDGPEGSEEAARSQRQEAGSKRGRDLAARSSPFPVGTNMLLTPLAVCGGAG
jgi:hypothetical protein